MESLLPVREVDHDGEKGKQSECVTIEELCMRVQAGQDISDTLLLLYERNRPLIAKWCWRYASLEDVEDLMQECFLILSYAAQRFDPGAGAQFASFLEICIQTGLIKYIRTSGSLITLPEGVRRQIAAYEKFKAEFTGQHGREPFGIEVMLALGISYDQYSRILSAISLKKTISLDAPIGEETNTLSDVIPDPEDPFAQLELELTQEQDAIQIRAAVDDLKPLQRDVINGLFFQKKTLDELSTDSGQKKSRLQSQKNNALRNLKHDLRIKKIGRDHGYGSYIYAGGIRRWRQTGYSSVEYAAIRHLEGLKSETDL